MRISNPTSLLIWRHVAGITFTGTEKFFSVETSFGVRLSWDGESVIFITIDNGLEGKVIGLCGGEASARWRRGGECFIVSECREENSTLTPPADIKTSSDTSQSKVEASIDYGCHNTVINDITCDDTHSDVYARNVCGFLFEEEAFVDCRQSLDPTPFYEVIMLHYSAIIIKECFYFSLRNQVCRMAVCERMSSFNNQSDVILCQSAMTYMLQCAASGVEVGQWMGKRGCQWGCPQGMEFTQCATKCPATCNSPQIDTSLYCHDNCLPGCQVIGQKLSKLNKTLRKFYFLKFTNFFPVSRRCSFTSRSFYWIWWRGRGQMSLSWRLPVHS